MKEPREIRVTADAAVLKLLPSPSTIVLENGKMVFPKQVGI